jgi:hypothetical protein
MQAGDFKSLAKYGVRSPKFIWAPCVKLYSLAETPQLPPPVWAHIRGRYCTTKTDDISLLPYALNISGLQEI